MAQPLTPKTPSKGINIEAWNDEATSATVPLSTASVSAAVAAGPAPIAKGTPLPLDIPLDAETEKSQTQQRREARLLKARIIAKEDGHDSDDDGPAPTGYVRRKSGGEPRRRDSMKRREALLKGKEGSRRRQKWENGMIITCHCSHALRSCVRVFQSVSDGVLQIVFSATLPFSLLSLLTGPHTRRIALEMCRMS